MRISLNREVEAVTQRIQSVNQQQPAQR